jgi:hypothetical protein
MKYQKLFDYMVNEHGVTLMQSDMQEIERIVLEQKNESFSGHELDGKTIPVTFHVYKYKPKIVIDFE